MASKWQLATRIEYSHAIVRVRNGGRQQKSRFGEAQPLRKSKHLFHGHINGAVDNGQRIATQRAGTKHIDQINLHRRLHSLHDL
jgi:hypothetical protein